MGVGSQQQHNSVVEFTVAGIRSYAATTAMNDDCACTFPDL